MNSKWSIVLSPRRLPAEFADVRSVSQKFGLAGLVVSGMAFLPGQHYLAYAVSAICAPVLGRIVGGFLHDGRAASTHTNGGGRARVMVSALLAAITLLGLLPAIYWLRTTGQPIFLAVLLVGAATLCYVIGRVMARRACGYATVVVVPVSVMLYLRIPLFGFVFAAGYAALIARALLFQKNAQASTPAAPAADDAGAIQPR